VNVTFWADTDVARANRLKTLRSHLSTSDVATLLAQNGRPADPPPLHRDRRPVLMVQSAPNYGGAFNAVGPSGHCTMGELLEAAVEVTGSDAELVWAAEEVIEEAGIGPWIELPIWVPQNAEYGGLHDGDVSAALDAGLTCRPMPETVADTWAWLQAEGDPEPRSKSRRLDPAKERQVLDRIAHP
jgi:2'-hydroxyisoflavone reductase